MSKNQERIRNQQCHPKLSSVHLSQRRLCWTSWWELTLADLRWWLSSAPSQSRAPWRLGLWLNLWWSPIYGIRAISSRMRRWARGSMISPPRLLWQWVELSHPQSTWCCLLCRLLKLDRKIDRHPHWWGARLHTATPLSTEGANSAAYSGVRAHRQDTEAWLQDRKPFSFPNSEVIRNPKLDPVAKQLLLSHEGSISSPPHNLGMRQPGFNSSVKTHYVSREVKLIITPGPFLEASNAFATD